VPVPTRREIAGPITISAGTAAGGAVEFDEIMGALNAPVNDNPALEIHAAT
jgi:hypothetical protein